MCKNNPSRFFILTDCLDFATLSCFNPKKPGKLYEKYSNFFMQRYTMFTGNSAGVLRM
jgi:hypothetical protein